MGALSSNKLLSEQKKEAAQSLALQTSMAEQPKLTTADNTSANKLRQLMSLRLGMASTMTGAGNLQGAPKAPAAKQTLGA